MLLWLFYSGSEYNPFAGRCCWKALLALRDLLQFLAVRLPLSDCKFAFLVNKRDVFPRLSSAVTVCDNMRMKAS